MWQCANTSVVLLMSMWEELRVIVDSKPNTQPMVLAVYMQLHHSLRNSRLSAMKAYKGLAPCDYGHIGCVLH